MIEFGIIPPRILLPSENFEKWAVVACDQFTSEPSYWEECDKIVGDAPSALRIILPEAYLDQPDEELKIESIKTTMWNYLRKDVLKELDEGFVLVSRHTSDGVRVGLVVAMDLECYDYTKGAKSLIRPTEDTITDRIPPRLRIRNDAPIESPHIMVLANDKHKLLIEPLESLPLKPLYQFELMQGGGKIFGYFVGKEYFTQIEKALLRLFSDDSMFYAVGDGNHSLATAKAYWENLKPTLSEVQRSNHPARFALVELTNIHSDGLKFQPIHRIAFDNKDALPKICACLSDVNCATKVEYYPSFAEANNAAAQNPMGHAVVFCEYGRFGTLHMEATHLLSYGTLQPALDKLSEQGEIRVDYIHGDESFQSLSENGVGFFMPSMKKEDLFPTVDKYGALPKKTFSMGNAEDKRYYLECKKIYA